MQVVLYYLFCLKTSNANMVEAEAAEPEAEKTEKKTEKKAKKTAKKAE